MRLSAQKWLGIFMDVSVEFLETSFIIRNRNVFAWENVVIKVNSDDTGGGFAYSAAEMLPKHSYAIGLGEFVRRDGTPLDSMPRSITDRPKNIALSCTTPIGDGLWGGIFV